MIKDIQIRLTVDEWMKKTQWKKNDEANNQNNQQKLIDWLKWYKQEINQKNEKKWMNKML